MEILLTWKAAVAAVGIIGAIYKGRQVKRAMKEVADVFEAIERAKADDGKIDAKEATKILKEAVEAIAVVLPFGRALFARFTR